MTNIQEDRMRDVKSRLISGFGKINDVLLGEQEKT